MASSVYKANVLAFLLDYNVVDFVSIKIHDSYEKVIEKSPTKLDIVGSADLLTNHDNLVKTIYKESSIYPKIIRFYGDVHTCRETLLSEIFADLDALDFLETNEVLHRGRSEHRYLNYSVFIEYIRERGEALSEERIQMILNFYNRFLTSRSGSPFFIQNQDRNIILSYKHNGELIRHYAASLILWIFRNTQIMQKCLTDLQPEAGKNLVSMKILMEFLSVEFLKNDNWGNNANPAVALSLFCFAYKYNNAVDTHLKSKHFSGPAYYAYKAIPTEIICRWVDDILYNNSPTNFPSFGCGLEHCGEEFQKLIYILWNKNSKIQSLNAENQELANKLLENQEKLARILEKGE